MRHPFYLAMLSLTFVATSACGHRYFAFRTTNPLIEDRVRAGPSAGQKMSLVSTRADRRTVLIVNHNQICAEPPPDVAEAVSSQAIAKLSTEKMGAGAASAFQTALMQLAQRSQGLEYFRTASFVYCNMYVINRSITPEQYNWYMAQAAAEAAKLIALQIQQNNLPKMADNLQLGGAPQVSLEASKLPPRTVEGGGAAKVPNPDDTNKNPVPGPDGTATEQASNGK